MLLLFGTIDNTPSARFLRTELLKVFPRFEKKKNAKMSPHFRKYLFSMLNVKYSNSSSCEL